MSILTQSDIATRAEYNLIECILVRHKAIYEAQKHITSSDFSNNQLGDIFQALQEIEKSRDSVNFTVLVEYLQRKRIAKEDVMKHIGIGSTSAGVEISAKLVAEMSRRRKIIQLVEQVQDAMRYDQDSDHLTGIMRQGLIHLKQHGADDIMPMHTALHKALEEIHERRERGDSLVGISTGFKALDIRSGGLKPGQLVVVAGRPGSGKSVFAKDLAQNAGVPVLYFSLEMGTSELISRQIADKTQTNYGLVQSGRMNDDKYGDMIDGAVSHLSEMPIYYVDNPALTIDKIVAISEGEKIEHDIGLIVIDYLQLIKPRSKGSREQEVADISRSLKVLAKTLNIPVICLAQLSRKCEERTPPRPKPSDLRESGSLEQDADLIFLLYRPAMYDETADPKQAEIDLAKGRSCITGINKVIFNGAHQKFEDREW